MILIWGLLGCAYYELPSNQTPPLTCISLAVASGVLFLRRLNVHNMYNIYLLTFGLKSWVCLGIQGHTPSAAPAYTPQLIYTSN